MANSKKKTKNFAGLIIFSAIAILIGLSIFFYFYITSPQIFSSTVQGYTLKANFYNQQGELITGGLGQTTVNGAEGIFYMSFILTASNIKNAELTNLRITESHQSDYTLALQGQLPLQTTLAVGESNIPILDTGNACTTDGECASNEKCVGTTTKKCALDVGNFDGQITFGVTIEADYLDALGQPQVNLVVVNLPITFEAESILLRFEEEKEGSVSSFTNSWLSYDINGDGKLEGFGGLSSTTSTSRTCENLQNMEFISYYGNFLVLKYLSENEVWLCENTGMGSTYLKFTTTDTDSLRAIITNVPTLPYKCSSTGGGICREIYTVFVTPSPSTCGNDLIEGIELCDGTDLGGNDCTTIGESFTGGDLACISCTSWDTSSCTGGEPSGGNIIFRTTQLEYSSSSAIALLIACNGNPLDRYGEVTSLSNSVSTCDAFSRIGAKLVSNIPYISGEVHSSGDGILDLYEYDYLSKVYPEYIVVCEDDDDGTGFYARYYKRDYGNFESVENSVSSIDSSREVAC